MALAVSHFENRSADERRSPDRDREVPDPPMTLVNRDLGAKEGFAIHDLTNTDVEPAM